MYDLLANPSPCIFHACHCTHASNFFVFGCCSGDPTMYEEFWRGTGDSASIFIPGRQTMSYFSDLGGICWFVEPGFEREVRRLHRLVGNAMVDGYHVLVGTGSTQLFQAVLYALSPASDGTPMNVVSPAPYYSVRIDQGFIHQCWNNCGLVSLRNLHCLKKKAPISISSTHCYVLVYYWLI